MTAFFNTQAELFPNMARDMTLEKDWESIAKRILEWLKERGV